MKDRANAVVQWLLAAEKDPGMIKGAWLLMLESDYVWRRPLQASGWGGGKESWRGEQRPAASSFLLSLPAGGGRQKRRSLKRA